MDDTKEILESFVQEQQFSNQMLADIFRELVTVYKHESDRQRLIRAVITMYKRKYGPEMAMFRQEMDRRKETATDEFASTGTQDQRLLFSFPSTLNTRLTFLVDNPPFLSDEAINKLQEDVWLSKEFPEFFVPSKY